MSQGNENGAYDPGVFDDESSAMARFGVGTLDPLSPSINRYQKISIDPFSLIPDWPEQLNHETEVVPRGTLVECGLMSVFGGSFSIHRLRSRHFCGQLSNWCVGEW